MGKLATLIALAPADRRAAAEALGELVRARLLVALVAPARWLPAPRVRGDGGAPDPAAMPRVRNAVARVVANLGPLAPRCLPQALAARRMLARRGIAADLALGTLVRPGPGEDRFHAWLTSGGAFVTGACDPARYARFVAKPPPHPPA